MLTLAALALGLAIVFTATLAFAIATDSDAAMTAAARLLGPAFLLTAVVHLILSLWRAA